MSTKKSLFILFITLLLDVLGIGMIIPIIPVLFTDPSSPAFILHGYSSQAQYIIAGLITASYGLMTFISAPILGELSDLYGRKKLLSLGIAILAISQFCFGLGITVLSLPIIFISRIMAGMAGGNFSIAQASIADISEPKDRAKNFGLIGAAFGLGFILGPMMGGLIASYTHNASAPFFLAGVLGIINLISVTIFLPETRKISEVKKHNITIFKAVHNIRQALTDKEASTVYVSNFLYMVGFASFTSFTGIFLVHKFGIGEAGLGTFFAINGIWIVITQGFILRIITKSYNEKQILRFSLIAVAFAISIMPLMPSILFIYVLIPFIAIPQGLSNANINSLVSKSVSADKQGAALGINSSLSALAQGLIPIFAGGITAFVGVSAPYVIAGVAILFAWKNLFYKKK